MRWTLATLLPCTGTRRRGPALTVCVLTNRSSLLTTYPGQRIYDFFATLFAVAFLGAAFFTAFVAVFFAVVAFLAVVFFADAVVFLAEAAEVDFFAAVFL